VLQRRLWKLRAATEEKLDEIAQQFGGAREALEGLDDDEDDFLEEDAPGLRAAAPAPSAREELERRLAEARARRRSGGSDIEEPLA
jgi:hypothetical protein